VKDLHLVGSIPLETAKAVFETFGRPLGAHLASMPNGEVGFRRHQRPRPDDGVLAPGLRARCRQFL
jgi:hypothetical protein